MSQSTVVLKLANYTPGSQAERIFLDISGHGQLTRSIDITDKMGTRIAYYVPSDLRHSYRIRVSFGPYITDQLYSPSAEFVADKPQAKLPLGQYVRDAICTAIK